VKSLAVCAARDGTPCAVYILHACATFRLHATSEKNYRRACLARISPGRRWAGPSRRIVRQQTQKNLCADADAGAAEASEEPGRAEEKRGAGKISIAETVRHPGEITVALADEKEKRLREPYPRGRNGARRLSIAQKKEEVLADIRTRSFGKRLAEEEEKIFANAFARFFGQPFAEEKETQGFSLAVSNARAISGAFLKSGPRGNSQRQSGTFGVPEEKRSAGYDRGQRDRRL
jgi:hypothetical protein